MKQARPAEACYPLRNVEDLVYSNKLKQNHKNIHENVTFTLASDEKSSRKNGQPQIWSDRYWNELNVWENWKLVYG